MIYITGDNTQRYWLKWFEKKRFTTLFIDGVKFFTFGGASSIDRVYRTPGLSW